MNGQQLFYGLGEQNISSSYPYGGTQARWNVNDKSPNVVLSATSSFLVVQREGGKGLVRATIPKRSGKWYWEIQLTTGAPYDCFLGVCNATCSLVNNVGATIDGWGIVMDGGDYYHGGFLGFAGGGTFPAPTGSVYGFALNMDAGSLTVYQNNVALTPTPLFSGITGMSGSIYPAMSVQNNNVVATANFGGSGMSYSPPAGYNVGVYL